MLTYSLKGVLNIWPPPAIAGRGPIMGRRNRRLRPSNTLAYDFWGTLDSGAKQVNAGDLKVDTNRPFKPVRVIIKFACVGSSSNYSIPTKYPVILISVRSPNKEQVTVSNNHIVTFVEKSLSVRIPRSIDVGIYGPSDTVFDIMLAGHAPGTIVTYSGTCYVKYSPHKVVSVVSLNQRILGFSDHCLPSTSVDDPVRDQTGLTDTQG